MSDAVLRIVDFPFCDDGYLLNAFGRGFGTDKRICFQAYVSARKNVGGDFERINYVYIFDF